MRGLAPGDDWTALLAGFWSRAAASASTNPALATAAIGVVEPRRSGMASGINSTFRQVGIATGIAAWGAVFQHVVGTEFVDQAAAAGLRGGPPPGVDVADFVAFGGAAADRQRHARAVAEKAFDAGLNQILLLAAIVALAGAVLSAVLVRPADFVTAHGRLAGPRA